MRGILETYRDRGVFDQDVDEAIAVMDEWYNGYRFATATGNHLYNTDMVLYYLKASIPNEAPPDDLIDTNVRIDYGKLRHLLTVNRQLNGNFDLLRHLIGTGWVDSEITSGFPLEHLNQRENFLSLLHYFGLLSIRELREGTPRLGIPNQTVRRLMYGYLIELKYLKRSAAATETRIAAAAREAHAQLRRYLADERLARQYPSVRFTGLAAPRGSPSAP